MKKLFTGVVAVAVAVAVAGAVGRGGDSPARAATSAQVAYAKLPLGFVANAGQLDRRVRYSAQGAGFGFFFTKREAVLSFNKGTRGTALKLRFVGARPDATLSAERALPGRVNYLLGNDRAKWKTNLRTYSQLRYRSLWPGIDLFLRGEQGKLKYEFLIRPGARVSDIRLAYRGAKSVSLGRAGSLRLQTSLGVLNDARPVSYQTMNGRRVAVTSRFDLGRHSAYGFAVENYDPRLPLVIDPGLEYSTYLGGTAPDQGEAIGIDGLGNAYVTGFTSSFDFPTTAGDFDTSANGDVDVFVTKLNSTGSALIYSTYLGGSDLDTGLGLAIQGFVVGPRAFVTGFTHSTDFPTTAGAFDTNADGQRCAFVAKLNAAGTDLVYSTYLGGSPTGDVSEAIALDGSGNAYVTGQTWSASFPTTAGAFSTSASIPAAFVTKLNADGSALVYSTYLATGAVGHGIAADGTGAAYVTGHTGGSFPTTPGAFDTTANGNLDAFVTKVNSAGSALVYSTYLGGSGDDQGWGIALDGAGSAYVTGDASATFPTTFGSFDTTANGATDAFATKLDSAGSALVYSTYLGGSGGDFGRGIALDGAGRAHVTGTTRSANFPTTAGAFDTSLGGTDDAFVAKLNTTGSSLVYSTYLGGSAVDFGEAIESDGANAYVTGGTDSANFPTTTGAFDTSFNSSRDAFVAKLDLAQTPATLTLEPKADTNPAGAPHTVTATVRDAGGNTLSGVTVRFSVSGANGATGSGVTDAGGQASFTYTGTTAGTDTINAYADSDGDGSQDAGEPGDTATKLYEAGPPASLDLEPESDTNTAGEQHCVTATVRDQHGNPVPGVLVDFGVSGANPRTGAAITDANGEASFCYTGTVAGTDTITATAQGGSNPSDTSTKTYKPGPPASVVLDPAVAVNTVGDEHCVTAHVTDAFGNPVPSVSVTFEVSGPATPVPAGGTATTDANGDATFCFTGTDVGTDVIRATAGSATGTATKTFAPPAVDRYKCYDAWEEKPRTDERTVVLTDQFVTNGEATIRKLSQLCNPVSQDGSTIIQRESHLTAYEVKDGKAFDPDKQVEVTNGFGTETFKVGKARELLLPASKTEIPPATAGSDPGPTPRFTDHYLCYEAAGADKVRTGISLVDQFGSDDVVVHKAKRLCTPVSKNGGRVLQPDVHLVCYELKKEEDLKKLVNTHDQFGLSVLRVQKSALLCVPSTKRVIPGA